MSEPDQISPAGGIVRGARRPLDWEAPGPPPARRPRPDSWPGPDEDLCWLTGQWRILQRVDGHRFALDDLVTAHFAAQVMRTTTPIRIADLGCGIGSVLLMLAWRFPRARLYGVEAQEVSAQLARRSVAWNGAEERCEVRLGDFRDVTVLSGEAPFDLVTGTPPYFPRGTGTESVEVQRAPCRFEHRGGVEDYCKAAVGLLAPGAAFVACAPSAQARRVADAAARTGLAVERWRDVVPRAGKAPLFSVFALRRIGEAASRLDEQVLLVRDARGRRTDEFVALRAAMGMPP